MTTLRTAVVRALTRLAAKCVSVFALAAALFGGGNAWATDGFVPRVAQARQPIDVHNLHLVETAEVGISRFDIDDHAFVGSMTFDGSCTGAKNLSLDAYEAISSAKGKDYSYWGFGVPAVRRSFATEMEKAGYPRYAPDLSLFETRLGTDADYRIAATFTKLEFHKCSTFYLLVHRSSTYVAARIELYSQRLQKTIYDKVIEASYQMEDSSSILDIEFNHRLLKQLADNLLADPEFVAAFHRPADEGGPAASASKQ